jgi:APA family basic amino acid/polyamine antiporter
LPRLVRKYDEKRDVAVNAVLISSAIGIVMLFSGNIYVMVSISNFGLLFSYLIASFSLIHFRRSKAVSSFKAPALPIPLDSRNHKPDGTAHRHAERSLGDRCSQRYCPF